MTDKNTKMKIGLVLPSLPAYSETFFRNKICGLQQNKIEVVLFVNDFKAPKEFLKAKVIKSPKLHGNKITVFINSVKQFFKAVFKNPKRSRKLFILNRHDGISFFKNFKDVLANQFILEQNLDWLHFGFGVTALGKENIAEVIEAKMAVSFRGFDYYVYPQKHPNCYDTLFSKKVKYHVLSERMKIGLVQSGISDKDIVKITPATDMSFFRLKESQKSEVLQIKTVSRLHWIKGLEYTLKALSLLKQDNIQFHYTIIGEGKEKERLLFAAHQLNLSENVTFTGKLNHDEIKQELETTDVYVQYSIEEGFCNAVLEAQAMGLLCVVSDAEGLLENILDNQTGWVVSKRNPELLAEKIKEIILLPKEHKENIKHRAAERVQKFFNLEKQQKEFIAFYTH